MGRRQFILTIASLLALFGNDTKSVMTVVVKNFLAPGLTAYELLGSQCYGHTCAIAGIGVLTLTVTQFIPNPIS